MQKSKQQPTFSTVAITGKLTYLSDFVADVAVRIATAAVLNLTFFHGFVMSA